MNWIKAKYKGDEFPDYFGYEIEVADDHTDPRFPCYKIRFVGSTEEIGNMGEEDIEWLDETQLPVAVEQAAGKLVKQKEVMVKCPECERVQGAVEQLFQGDPFWTYVHECAGCKHTIMESEWNRVEPFIQQAAGNQVKDDPIINHVRNVKLLQAVYSGKKFYVECAPTDEGAKKFPNSNLAVKEIELPDFKIYEEEKFGYKWQADKQGAGWIKAIDQLPEVGEKFGDSDYLQCYDEALNCQFVAWYNKKMNSWYLAHHQTASTPVGVTHYRPLMKSPLEQESATPSPSAELLKIAGEAWDAAEIRLEEEKAYPYGRRNGSYETPDKETYLKSLEEKLKQK